MSLYDKVRRSKELGCAPNIFYVWCIKSGRIERRNYEEAHFEDMYQLSTMPEEELREWIAAFSVEET